MLVDDRLFEAEGEGGQKRRLDGIGRLSASRKANIWYTAFREKKKRRERTSGKVVIKKGVDKGQRMGKNGAEMVGKIKGF